jgi:hypothetical protein
VIHGWYCFRAEYTPDIASNYLAVTHSDATDEYIYSGGD